MKEKEIYLNWICKCDRMKPSQWHSFVWPVFWPLQIKVIWPCWLLSKLIAQMTTHVIRGSVLWLWSKKNGTPENIILIAAELEHRAICFTIVRRIKPSFNKVQTPDYRAYMVRSHLNHKIYTHNMKKAFKWHPTNSTVQTLTPFSVNYEKSLSLKIKKP